MSFYKDSERYNIQLAHCTSLAYVRFSIFFLFLFFFAGFFSDSPRKKKKTKVLSVSISARSQDRRSKFDHKQTPVIHDDVAWQLLRRCLLDRKCLTLPVHRHLWVFLRFPSFFSIPLIIYFNILKLSLIISLLIISD